MTIGDLISKERVTVESHATLFDIAQTMKDHGVGVVSVVKEGKLVGVITNRDMVLRAISERGANRTLRAEHMMTSHPVTISQHGEVKSAVELMRRHHIRHLVVSDDNDDIAGVISIEDIWKHHPNLLDFPHNQNKGASSMMRIDDLPCSEGHYLG